VFTAHEIPQLAHLAVLPGGEQREVPPPDQVGQVAATSPAGRANERPPASPSGATSRRALGELVGARSGDKGGDANLGVWARSDAAYAWLHGFLTVERLKELLPEAAPLPTERHELPGLRALNFVIHGLLGQGVAASTRFDPQAKALGEWLRSRLVDIPEEVT
jgi:hypothetical protein